METSSFSNGGVKLMQRELHFLTLSPGVQAPLLTALAWAVLSATFSGETETSVAYFDPLISHEPIRVALGLDNMESVHELYEKLRENVEEYRRSTNGVAARVSTAGHESFRIEPRLPRTMIATNLDTTVQKLVEEGYCDMALATTETSDADRFNLAACTTKTADNRDLDTILDRVESLVSQLLSKELKIGDLDLICVSDRTQIAAWNETMPPPLDVCVLDLIDRQVSIRPHNQAVRAWDGSFTYEELNQRAEALATRLIEAGVGFGSFVPLMFEKSKWQPVSLLAVLKSGAAFVALEHTIPDGRILNMLRQFKKLPLVLASKSQRARLEDLFSNVFIVDEHSTKANVPGVLLPGSGDRPKVQFDSPAYAIFTSGTTGTPKGAIIEHRQLSTSMQALNDRIGATADMRLFQMTAYNFDLSISETFCPLLCGGCVAIPSEWARFNDLAHAFDDLDANFGSFSPSFLATLSEKEFPKMKNILLAGERISADLSNFWTRSGRRVVHMYGPTECTVGCCFLDTDVQIHYDGFIGEAYASKVWITDPENSERLMPIGAPGELVVEGPIVGSHYLGDPEKTRKSFIEPPKWFFALCRRKPSRFYKTGDLGRLTKNGSFEIIGRKDLQIKIRGLRVEIQEIEHQIKAAAESNIGIAVVVHNPNRIPGQELLIAFLEVENQAEVKPSTGHRILYEELGSPNSSFSKMLIRIKPWLRNVLPDYMIPSMYLPVSSLPFSNSYKLNRGVLREMANNLSISEAQDAVSGKDRNHSGRALTEDELTLCNIWATALQTTADSIDIQDDFFYIGGDSLKAMALISEARRNGMHFTVANLYKARNIANLSQMIGEESYDSSIAPAFSLINEGDIAQIQRLAAEQCNIEADMIQDIMPVTDMQYFFVRDQRRQPQSWRVPVFFDLPSGIDTMRLQRAWEQLMARHPITRTRFIDTARGIYQVALKHDTVLWRYGTSEDELVESLKTTDLSFGHTTYACALLKREDETPTRLIWYVNHGISDGIMDAHIAREFAMLYQGQALSLPKRPAFKNFIQHQLQRDCTVPRNFWKSHLKGARYKAIFENATKTTESFADANLLYRGSIECPVQLRKFREHSFVMTALALAIGRYVGADDVPFFLLHAGRTSTFSGSEDVMGPLLTRAPVRIRTQPNRRLVDMLHDVGNDLESCLEHEIVDEEEFRAISPEAAEHLAHAVVVNFQSPFSDLILDPTALFSPRYDPRYGRGYRTYAFAINISFQGQMAVVKLMWKEDTVSRESIDGLVESLGQAFRYLEKMDDETDTNQALQ